MFDKIIMRGLGGALIFAGLTAAALAAGWLTAILGAVILLCAALYCAAAISEANAENKEKQGSRKRLRFWERGAAAGKVKLLPLAAKRANRRDATSPIADDVRRVKIKEGSQKVRRTFWEEGATAGKGADPAEQAGQAKRRDATWVRKYYNGEFDPEDDTSRPAEPTALPKGRAYETASAASKIKKFVL